MARKNPQKSPTVAELRRQLSALGVSHSKYGRKQELVVALRRARGFSIGKALRTVRLIFRKRTLLYLLVGVIACHLLGVRGLEDALGTIPRIGPMLQFMYAQVGGLVTLIMRTPWVISRSGWGTGQCSRLIIKLNKGMRNYQMVCISEPTLEKFEAYRTKTKEPNLVGMLATYSRAKDIRDTAKAYLTSKRSKGTLLNSPVQQKHIDRWNEQLDTMLKALGKVGREFAEHLEKDDIAEAVKIIRGQTS